MNERPWLRVAAALTVALMWSPLAAAAQDRGTPQTSASGDTDTPPTRVPLDELEAEPHQYMGRTITVDASVDDVWGPRLFTVNEPRWGDLDGELLVFIPTVLAAGVRERDRVTITGRLTRLVQAEFAREWGWQTLGPQPDVDVATKPVLVASRIEMTNGIVQVALSPPMPTPPNRIPPSPVRTTDTGVSRLDVTLTDASRVAVSTDAVVGRTVDLAGLGVSGVSQGGLVVNAGLGQLFVLPATSDDASVGDRVDVQGVILRMPRSMRSRIDGPAQMNRDIYIFATRVTGR